MKLTGRSREEMSALIKHDTGKYVLRDVGVCVDHMEQVIFWL